MYRKNESLRDTQTILLLKAGVLDTLYDFILIDNKLVLFEVPDQTDLSRTFAMIKIRDRILSGKLKKKFDGIWEEGTVFNFEDA